MVIAFPLLFVSSNQVKLLHPKIKKNFTDSRPERQNLKEQPLRPQELMSK